MGLVNTVTIRKNNFVAFPLKTKSYNEYICRINKGKQKVESLKWELKKPVI